MGSKVGVQDPSPVELKGEYPVSPRPALGGPVASPGVIYTGFTGSTVDDVGVS